uniref:scopoletin 8-hydroxylase-like isoform X2 n=1 Tax=Styela clava TaxID=7725 RepID=UPI001939E0BE|nr:scopoletin 8-hydroxylase-like isoform X2 [Styela clava]
MLWLHRDRSREDKEYLMKCHSRMNDARNLTTLRTHYYSHTPDKCSFKPGQVRPGEHTDFGSFTILFQDKVGGLQVKASNGEYVDATPIPGTALVNIGDALQFCTQGRLKSTEHRTLKTMTFSRPEKLHKSPMNPLLFFSI